LAHRSLTAVIIITATRRPAPVPPMRAFLFSGRRPRPSLRPNHGILFHDSSGHGASWNLPMTDASHPAKTLGSVTAVHGDALQVLPTLTGITTIITDPVWPTCPVGLLPGSEDPQGLWDAAMALIPDTVHRMIVVMRRDCDPRFLASVPKRLRFLAEITLPYAVPAHAGRVLMSHEVAYWFGIPVRSVKGRHLVPGRGPVSQPTSRRKAIGHPCPRAQAHIDWVVERCSDVDDVICDPFSGAGSTLVAAATLGRRAVGIEIDAGYHAAACSRIEEALRQGDLLIGMQAA
jgi:hypothetical protein